MITTTVKVRNGLAKLLPKELRGFWEDAEAIMRVSPDTVILKKVQAPSEKLSAIAGRISARPLSVAEINKEIAAYRQKK